MNNRLRINENDSRLTISDIAEELGLSKSTVSRVLSGTGRIGDETRKRVMDCVNAHDFKPNPLAKGLAVSKTFNIGVILPGDADESDMPFFQTCLTGIAESAVRTDYDVLVSTDSGNNTVNLERMIKRGKVDGVILTRLLENDTHVKLLQQSGTPAVIIGSSSDSNLVQVDSNNEKACCAFTTGLINSDCHTFAFISGDKHIIVNNQRYTGFLQALQKTGIPVDNNLVQTNVISTEQLHSTMEKLMQYKFDCLICADDILCGHALSWLYAHGYQIPKQIKVASFYNSSFLSQYNPPVSAIDIDIHDIGATAANLLLSLIHGEQVEPMTYVDYRLLYRDSTRQQPENE